MKNKIQEIKILGIRFGILLPLYCSLKGNEWENLSMKHRMGILKSNFKSWVFYFPPYREQDFNEDHFPKFKVLGRWFSAKYFYRPKRIVNHPDFGRVKVYEISGLNEKYNYETRMVYDVKGKLSTQTITKKEQ